MELIHPMMVIPYVKESHPLPWKVTGGTVNKVTFTNHKISVDITVDYKKQNILLKGKKAVVELYDSNDNVIFDESVDFSKEEIRTVTVGLKYDE